RMAAGCALLAALCGRALAAAPAAAPPRLVLFVAVDQLRPDALERGAAHFTGGFKRLREEGALFTHAHYQHANTETGPGHGVLLSGRHARDTGIVGNEWYDRTRGREVNVVEDPLVRALPGPGRACSPAHFVGVTVGDLLKAASPRSRVVSVALKDRAAVLMGGRRPDAAYWYEPAAGRFGSSTYYMAALPPWLVAWNAGGHVDALGGREWTRLLEDTALYEKLAGPDDVVGERTPQDRVFPHRIPGRPPQAQFYDELRRTPFADELTLDVAVRAMDAHELGRDEATDILAVGFSATDLIGHAYGPHSQEVMDQMLRLDRTLGRLLEAGEARAGRGRVLVVLSADHGAMPLVETLRAQGVDARRVRPEVLETAVRKALAARFPDGERLLADFVAPDVYFDLEALRARGLRRSQVEAVVEEAMLATGLVERVYTPARILADPPAGDPDFDLFRNSFFEPRSGHVMARVKRYVRLTTAEGGSGHGTADDYDRHVPVALLGAGVRQGRFDAPCGPHDIAPTLAALLGLEYRLDAGQRVLAEALAEGARAARAGDRP
ncbi:MAG TPA: alkaline phosphatase family protein, partial [Vicinamibacteria bacterium]|nr:alkaline phosphatase family protein [Vicinamibacteria bacterium]